MRTYSPLIIDIAGTELSDLDKTRLKNPLVGGVIYFQRNWVNRVQLEKLSKSIKRIRNDLLILVDHEGGRVQRFFGDDLTFIPAMEKIAKVLEKESANFAENLKYASELAYACGYVSGSQLRSLDIDLALGPVLDIDYERCSALQSRTLGKSSQHVVALARPLMEGLRDAGMANCGKHFPGHGYTQVDTHFGQALDTRSYEDIFKSDMNPYRELIGEVKAVMPSHVIYPAVDKNPAGFSSYWLQTVLQKKLNFKGCIISDDLGMAAASLVDGKTISQAMASCLAITAGCDIVLACNLSIRESGKEYATPPDPRNIPCWSFNSESSWLDDLLLEFEQLGKEGKWSASPSSEARRLSLLPNKDASTWQMLQTRPSYLEALQKIKSL